MATYYVYILRTNKNTLYTGQTNNLEKRLKEHQARNAKSSKYVRAFDSFELVYQEEFPNRSQAMKREWQLKQLSKESKEKIIKEKSSVKMG